MKRTFDLKGKPYSRYMLFFDKGTNSLVPGINVLTKDCNVKPHNYVNVITGIRFKYYKAVGEIGYELWILSRANRISRK